MEGVHPALQVLDVFTQRVPRLRRQQPNLEGFETAPKLFEVAPKPLESYSFPCGG